jgi:hypothetical protein
VDRRREVIGSVVVARVAVIGEVSAQDVMARLGVGRNGGLPQVAALVDHGLPSHARLVYRQPGHGVATGLTTGVPQGRRAHWAATGQGGYAPRLAVGLERCELMVKGQPRIGEESNRTAAGARGAPWCHGRVRRADRARLPDAAWGRRWIGGFQRRSPRRFEQFACERLPCLEDAAPRALTHVACRFPCGFLHAGARDIR